MARSLENQRPARRFSDSETTTTRKRTDFRPFDYSKEMFGKRQSVEGSQVYNIGKGFQQKYGYTNATQGTNTLESSSYWAKREVDQLDDETKSFCDSVSSIAFSNFARTDVDKRTPLNKSVPDKIAKHQDIEKWLESLPAPGLYWKVP